MRDDWEVRNLGEVCSVVAGQSPDGRFYNVDGHGLPFYQGKKDFGSRHLGAPSKWTTQITKVADPGDILMSVRAPVGPVNFTRERVCIGRGLAAIKAGPAIDNQFLYLQLQALEHLISGSEGAVFPSISKAQIERIPLSVPPLAEQERIVTILDEAMDRIRLLQRRRRSVSDSLGEFATSFLEKALAVGDPWPMVALASTASLFTDGDWIETKDQAASGVRLIQTGNIGFGKDRSDKARFVSRQTFERLKCTEVLPGDCLVARLPEPVGRSCVVPPLGGPLITAVDCTIIRFKPEVVVSGFFRLISQSASYLNQVERACTGTTRKRISRSNLGRILIPLPPPEEQARLVASVQRVEAQVGAAQAINSAQDSCLNELRASLLHEAFTGGL